MSTASSLAYALKSNPWFMSVYKSTVGALRNASHFSDLKAHEVMLADRVRVDTYYRAISRQVPEGGVVIDLGTGTGILAMLAARRAAKVYAIDHSNIIDKARRIAHENGFSNIEFVRINSRRFTPPEKVDVILHEQIAYDLFSENMVDNLRDLRARILKPEGRILPAQFDVYIEPVQLKDEYRTPLLWEQDIYGIKFSSLRTPHTGHLRTVVKPFTIERFLGAPSPVLSIDLNTDQAIASRASYRREVVYPGRLDGFAMYFVVRFDEDIAFSTSPFDKHTHWDTPLFRTEGSVCRAGDVLEFDVDMSPLNAPDVWAWRYAKH